MAESTTPLTIAVADLSIGEEDEVRRLVGSRAEVRYGPMTTPQEVAELTRGADAVIVTLQSLAADRVAALDDRIRVVGRAGVGLDTIDLEAAAARGVTVVHEPTGTTEEVATHAVALLHAAHRHIGEAAAMIARGWDLVTNLPRVTRLSELTLGLVGFGAIGRTVARMMAPSVAGVVAYDPAVADEVVAQAGAERASSLEDLLVRSDLLSLHVPLLPSTRNLIGAEQLDLLGPDGVLVNVSRGGIVDEDALADALLAGRLRSAALDVFATEPLPDDSPLRSAPRLVMTPHVAWYSDGASDRVAEWTVDDVLDVLAGEEPRHGRIAARPQRERA